MPWRVIRPARVCCTVLVTLLLFGPAWAQDKPPPDHLRRVIANHVPPYWQIEQVAITASVNRGDPVEPKLKQRFEAAASPTTDLFVAKQDTPELFAPFRALLPTVKTGTERTLYGVAHSSYSAGKWSTEIELENDVADTGQLRDLFNAPTFVLGGDKEAELAERLKTTQLKALRTELAQARDKLRHQQAQEIAALKRKHRQKIAELKAQYQQKRQAQKQKLEALEAKQANKIDALRKRLDQTDQLL